MIIGLPQDDPSVNSMIQTLADRGGPKIGIHLSRHLETCFWIWAKEKKDNQHVYLRHVFEVKEMPTRAWVEAVSDNNGHIYINGKSVGVSDNWRRPDAFEVAQLLHPGRNIVAVDGANEDGPAGILLRLHGLNPTGDVVLDVKTDKNWKVLETAPPPNWTALDIDESAWAPAKQIAINGEGTWEDKVEANFQADQYLLHISDAKHPAIAGLTGFLGRCVVTDGLKPNSSCIPIIEADKTPVALAGEGAAGRLVLLGFEPEKTPRGTDRASSSPTASADFLLQSILWLSRQPDTAHVNRWRIPETAAGNQTIRLNATAVAPSTFQFIAKDSNGKLYEEKGDLKDNSPLAIAFPVPQSWKAGGTISTSLIVKAGDEITCARTGSITIIDSVPLDLSPLSKRWVYKPGETLELEANLAPQVATPMGHLELKVMSNDSPTRSFPRALLVKAKRPGRSH